MSPHPEPAASPTALDDLMRRLLRSLAGDKSRFILVRSHDGAASATLIADLLDRHDRAARVVRFPSVPMPAAYRSPVSSTRPWTVLLASEVPGSIDITARSMCAATTVLRCAPDDAILRSLWLPPSVLEGYSQLPPSPGAVLVLDDWHALVADYLGGASAHAVWAPAAHDLDPLLVESFQSLSHAHLIVVTTRSSPTLDYGADVVVDVRPRDAEHRVIEVRVARDPSETSPSAPYLFRVRPDGLLETDGGPGPFR